MTLEITTEYVKSKDFLHVMKMLDHRNIQNTLLYTQIISFENDEFDASRVKTVKKPRNWLKQV